MLGRDRHGIAEPQVERLDRGGEARALGLVGDQDHGLVRAAQPVGEMAVERHHAGARIDEEERHVGILERALGLRPHARRKLARRRVLEPGRVDHAEAQIAQAPVGLAPVARHARRVVDQRQAPSREPVEQSRLADIGPAEDRDGEGHAPPPSAARRGRPRR